MCKKANCGTTGKCGKCTKCSCSTASQQPETPVVKFLDMLKQEAAEQGMDLEVYLDGIAGVVTEGSGARSVESEDELIALVKSTKFDSEEEKFFRDVFAAEGYSERTQDIALGEILYRLEESKK